jgi:hypothetical protein
MCKTQGIGGSQSPPLKRNQNKPKEGKKKRRGKEKEKRKQTRGRERKRKEPAGRAPEGGRRAVFQRGTRVGNQKGNKAIPLANPNLQMENRKRCSHRVAKELFDNVAESNTGGAYREEPTSVVSLLAMQQPAPCDGQKV